MESLGPLESWVSIGGSRDAMKSGKRQMEWRHLPMGWKARRKGHGFRGRRSEEVGQPLPWRRRLLSSINNTKVLGERSAGKSLT